MPINTPTAPPEDRPQRALSGGTLPSPYNNSMRLAHCPEKQTEHAQVAGGQITTVLWRARLLTLSIVQYLLGGGKGSINAHKNGDEGVVTI